MRQMNLFEYSRKLFEETISVKSGNSIPEIRCEQNRDFKNVEIILRREPLSPMTLSVLIPTFNRPFLLERAIHSVVDQNRQDFEIVIVNDGGHRVSSEVLEQLRKFSLPVTVVNHPENLGPAAARNTAAHLAHGIWLMMLDDDDELMREGPDSLLDAGRKSRSHFIHGDHLRRYFDENGLPVEEEQVVWGNDVMDLLFYENRIVNGSFIVTKELFDHLQGYREDLAVHEDYHFHIRAAHIQSFEYVNAPTFVYNCRNSLERLNLNSRLFWFSTSMLNHALFSYFFPLNEGLAREQKIGEYEHLARALEEKTLRTTVIELIRTWLKLLSQSNRKSDIEQELLLIEGIYPSMKEITDLLRDLVPRI